MQAIFLCLAVVSLSEVVWCLLGRKWVKCYEGRQGSLVPVTCALPNDRCCSLYFDNKTNAGSCWYELVQDSVTAIRRVPMINGVRACCMEDYCNDERHLQKHLQEASQYLEPFSPIDHDGFLDWATPRVGAQSYEGVLSTGSVQRSPVYLRQSNLVPCVCEIETLWKGMRTVREVDRANVSAHKARSSQTFVEILATWQALLGIP
ncbi:unnamed protein product [Toxocara canis]|uniref:Activin_recp domain-containing protein n=1 Tax=Toxocara canis TaxID=6265 RepID=A0A183UVS9_TOXCA|nr:unnamed protein product [Toxocara canis]